MSLNRRLRLAPESRTDKGLVGVQGFPDVGALVAEFGIKDGESYPISKEALLLWTFRAAHQEIFKSRGIRVEAGLSQGPLAEKADLKRQALLSDIERCGDSVNPTLETLCRLAAALKVDVITLLS
jgi:DNA-binding XRE family transcriptional regulator